MIRSKYWILCLAAVFLMITVSGCRTDLANSGEAPRPSLEKVNVSPRGAEGFFRKEANRILFKDEITGQTYEVRPDKVKEFQLQLNGIPFDTKGPFCGTTNKPEFSINLYSDKKLLYQIESDDIDYKINDQIVMPETQVKLYDMMRHYVDLPARESPGRQ